MTGAVWSIWNILTILSLVTTLFSVFCDAESPSGVIALGRARQMLLASLQPSQDMSGTPISSQLFLTSPTGNFAAYIVRQESPGNKKIMAHELCYIQVQGSGTPSNGFSTSTTTSPGSWQLGCVPVSSSDTCSLVLSDSGLEIYGGTQPKWHAGPEEGHSKALALLDSGDLEISDQNGKISWKAREAQTGNNQSDNGSYPKELSNQNAYKPQLGNGFQPQQEMIYPQQQGVNQPLSGSNQPLSSSFSQPFGSNDQQGFKDPNAPFENGVLKSSVKQALSMASITINIWFLL